MKPLTRCPHCNAVLNKKDIPEHLNPLIYEICSARCAVDYIQYYKQSYNELEVDYITFNTPNDKFRVYMYFNHRTYKNIAYIYSNATTKKYGYSSPILKLPLETYKLDVTKMDALYEKISTLSLFV